ncbi:enoyl-CoA hydratase [Pseudoteredinibacter isoporae]|uniref:Enoyl-CoA hydratase/carnithine racemase n=1 Tax=Pseudoteredinibacter isoporae TaxID=570281 RepID=A0A7X0JQZ7_9GAMM|nr:enoyl-CoA hydratase [Pseudoteredinibacter isoporae]MBB6519756.1 enoyl-CoA hydratase/carnithine racemase [Pseudoteredinibacter isoporae]NHO85337.1 enoyl-CoA hydratase [Pseudoteredinibacter isoporae]NIB26211.1 enoyl-CoA hydratase [Pseudoteredinibacter isoporae]
MSETGLLKYETRGHTCIITMNNPPANTWTPESLRELKAKVEELNADKDNYALIIASESEKFFSAGADLNRFNHDDKGQAFEFIGAFGEAFEALAHYQGVSIAAITGFAMGGGLETALACDIRVCEEQAQLALPEAAVGLLPGGLGTQHLPWLVGEAWAKRMILLGERVKAPKAEQIGLVQEVVPTGSVLEKAIELADKVAGQSPTSVRVCKELIMAARNQTMNSARALERETFVKLWDTQDQKEGVAAFIEKRKPDWKNA